MINIYNLLAQMSTEERDIFYFFLEDMQLTSKTDLIRKAILEEINTEFPA